MTDQPDITPAVLLEHMQGMKYELQTQLANMESSVTQRFDQLDGKVDRLDRRISVLEVGVENIDERLDRIETTLLEQAHEARIVRLENTVGLTPIS